ncbi:hypothetical protein Kfla_4210 [Kribbella flavida DSM 17836]|uniref:Uncharacterized protein n=1 Tax=Kribbella flavida (strain DSM 17836 / JCM 10339 / NBRC 14399) TaxID=479435 RepID=D2PTW4_KRIFD|nr:hypothetical protein [Kribbella flavida]ADB33247.1 hypothetical protein Kfla_4210 [Kribbella flavida DSM 17836]
MSNQQPKRRRSSRRRPKLSVNDLAVLLIGVGTVLQGLADVVYGG